MSTSSDLSRRSARTKGQNLNYFGNRERMSPPRQDKLPPRYDGNCLRIAIDYGTATLAAAYQLKIKSTKQDCAIKTVRFDSSSPTSPMRLNWDKNKHKLHWGQEVVDMVSNGVEQEDVIDLVKLALYKKTGGDRAVIRLNEQLDALKMSPEDLISHHLKLIVEHVVNFIADAEDGDSLQRKHLRVSQMDREIFIGVPQAWSPLSFERMANAVKASGINGQLVLEPQCVAAFHLMKTLDSRVEAGGKEFETKREEAHEYMIVDAGGGTVDIVKYTMGSAKGPRGVLKTVGIPQSHLIGSTLINTEFVNVLEASLEENPDGNGGSIKDRLQAAGIDDEKFRQETYWQFEDFKKGHSSIKRLNNFTYRGIAGTAPVYIDVKSNTIKDAIDHGISRVVQLIMANANDKTRTVVLSGGFGTNEELYQAVKKACDSKVKLHRAAGKDEPNPVTHGALYRKKEIEVAAIPSAYTYFVIQDQVYNKNKHPDARNDQILRVKSKYDNRQIVKNRIGVLVEKNADVSEDKLNGHSWIDWITPATGEKVLVGSKIYWSKQIMKSNDPVTKYEGEYEQLNDLLIPIDISVLHRHGYKVQKGRNGAPDYWRITGRVAIKAAGAMMRTAVQICTYGKRAQACRVRKSSKHIHNIYADTVSTVTSTTLQHDLNMSPSEFQEDDGEEGSDDDEDEDEDESEDLSEADEERVQIFRKQLETLHTQHDQMVLGDDSVSLDELVVKINNLLETKLAPAFSLEETRKAIKQLAAEGVVVKGDKGSGVIKNEHGSECVIMGMEDRYRQPLEDTLRVAYQERHAFPIEEKYASPRVLFDTMYKVLNDLSSPLAEKFVSDRKRHALLEQLVDGGLLLKTEDGIHVCLPQALQTRFERSGEQQDNPDSADQIGRFDQSEKRHVPGFVEEEEQPETDQDQEDNAYETAEDHFDDDDNRLGDCEVDHGYRFERWSNSNSHGSEGNGNGEYEDDDQSRDEEHNGSENAYQDDFTDDEIDDVRLGSGEPRQQSERRHEIASIPDTSDEDQVPDNDESKADSVKTTEFTNAFETLYKEHDHNLWKNGNIRFEDLLNVINKVIGFDDDGEPRISDSDARKILHQLAIDHRVEEGNEKKGITTRRDGSEWVSITEFFHDEVLNQSIAPTASKKKDKDAGRGNEIFSPGDQEMLEEALRYACTKTNIFGIKGRWSRRDSLIAKMHQHLSANDQSLLQKLGEPEAWDYALLQMVGEGILREAHDLYRLPKGVKDRFEREEEQENHARDVQHWTQLAEEDVREHPGHGVNGARALLFFNIGKSVMEDEIPNAKSEVTDFTRWIAVVNKHLPANHVEFGEREGKDICSFLLRVWKE